MIRKILDRMFDALTAQRDELERFAKREAELVARGRAELNRAAARADATVAAVREEARHARELAAAGARLRASVAEYLDGPLTLGGLSAALAVYDRQLTELVKHRPRQS